MDTLPQCPKCSSQYTYLDRSLHICPECAHEWGQDNEAIEAESVFVVKDANGNLLQDGDDVTVIKDLKVGGSAIKVGTKVKGIKLSNGPNGHNIDCRIKGFGAMMLKSEFVKKT